MNKKPIIKKTTKTAKSPIKKASIKKAPAKKTVIKETSLEKKQNRWFVIFCTVGLFLAAIFFLLIRVNLYYDNLELLASEDAALLERSYINKLPPAEAAADPTVSGLFNINNNQPAWSQNDAYLGNLRGAVKIFYFADYNSQASREQEKTLRRLAVNYPEQVLLVRKDFPSMEALSLQSARAARCAQEQGDYWKYHDILLAYLNRDQKIVEDILYDEDAPSKTEKLSESKNFLLDLAERGTLDMDKFTTCFEKPGNVIVSDNVGEGERLGISGVPTIYINGQQFIGSLSYQDLERLTKMIIAK
ncbi:MAG: thioredoxin domain-containing protein [Patescibacteria group bacterium]|nr:thioredoxin domain-containing protein [Patescibacteria group bacterium]